MSFAIANEDVLRGRTRAAMTVSVLVHVVLLLLLAFVKTEAHVQPSLTEVTLLDPSELAASAPASGPSAEAVPAAASTPVVEHFRRATPQAEVAPRPQSDRAYEDRLASRLSALQQGTVSAPLTVAGGGGHSPLAVAAPAGPMPGGGGGHAPLALSRGGGEGPPLSLTRGTSSSLAPSLAATGLPAGRSGSAAPAPASEQAVRRTLAGAALAGPIADRPILHYVAPVYPEWAKRDAVEGSVTLYFVVRPDGGVKENVLVQKTAGFEDFDENARAALRDWKFQPLREGRTGEQWGTITFRFRLGEG